MSRVLVAEWWELWSKDGLCRIEQSGQMRPEPRFGKHAFSSRQEAIDTRRRLHSPGFRIKHVRRYRVGQ